MGWPTADGAPWTWAWTAYPAVWVALAVALAIYAAALAWLRRRPNATLDVTPHRRKQVYFVTGVLTTWLALDWPVGALAANLFWIRTSQYLILSLIAAPLLLLGTPPLATPRPRWPRWLRHLGRFLPRPLIAAVLFAIVLLVSHMPVVVNAVEPDPLLAALLRGAWLLVALVYWWPLVGPGPERDRLPYLGAVIYLTLPFLLPKAPGVLYVFASSPVYEVYDHGGGAWGLDAMADQGIAGFLLWIIGSLVVLGAVYAFFRRWSSDDRAMRNQGSLATPADPDAIARLLGVPGAWQAFEQLVAIVEDSVGDSQRASLLFRTRRRRVDRTWRDQVVLVVQFAGNERERELLYNRVVGQYAAHVAGYDEGSRVAIGDCLTVEVERVGARVQ